MTPAEDRKDLVVLVADGAMKATVRTLLSRRQESLRIRLGSFEVIECPNYDSGVFGRGHELLRSQQSRYGYAITICDLHGCGKDFAPREELERIMEQRLQVSGWAGRAAAIAIDPELEIWAWANSPHVARVLGWTGRSTELQAWLQDNGFCVSDQSKPERPKEAWEKALRLRKKPKSSALFQDLATTITLDGCMDPAFVKLKATLQRWFPA